MNSLRIFLAGASGTLGRRLVPQLVARGHQVTGTTRSRVDELRALAALGLARNFDKVFAMSNRLRTEGTDHLIAAAQAAGARRLVWQSYAGWPYAREGSTLKTEDDPLDPDPPADARRSLAAIRHLEAAVLSSGLEGVVLRYGGFYG